MKQRTLATALIAILVLTQTPLALAGDAPKQGSIVIFDVQDGTGQFQGIPAGHIVLKALAAEGLRGLDFADLELGGKYATSPVTHLDEPTPEALERAAEPTEAEFGLLFVIMDYGYDEETDVARVEANVQSLRRGGAEGQFASQASLVFAADSPQRPRSTRNERLAQRRALQQLARDAGHWLRAGSGTPGKPLPRPARKKSKMMTYALIGGALIVLLLLRKDGGTGGGNVSSDCDPPRPGIASPAGDGVTSLTWRRPDAPTGGLTLEGYEIAVSLDPSGDRFVGFFGENATSAIVNEGVGEGGDTRAEFRIRSRCQTPAGNTVVSRWAFWPAIFEEDL